MGYKDILRSVANINADNRKKQEEERRKKKATGSSNVERSVNNTAPAATRGGSGRLGAVTKATSQSAATGNDTYFEEEQRTSERMKNRRTYTQQDYGVRGDRVLPSGYSDNKVRSTSRQGAGKLKTTFANGTARYQYERNGNNANVPYGYTAAENGTWQQRKSSPVANKLADKVGVDRTARYMTQETDHTVKYDDGKRTEYFEIQGSGSNAHLVSVPEERYYQRQQLDGGLNPSTMTPYNRLRGAAEHGIKNAVHGMKSTIGSIKANTNEEQRAYDYMSRTDGGNSLNRRRNMLMESYGAGSAAQRGDVRKARTYINQETFDDAMNERRQLEEQKRLDQMYQAYKAGASRPMQLAMDVVDTTANMAPGMVSNVLLPGSFIPEMAVQAYGNSYNQARNNGATREQAILSGIQNAAVESLSEMMFAGGRALGKATGVRGIFHPGREIEEASLGFIKSTAGKDVIRAVQKLGLAGSEEGAEEIVAGLVEPVLDTLIYQGGVDALKDKDFWTNTVHEALYNGLVGFASGGGFGAVDVVQSIRQGADIRANADVANIINQGLAMPEDTRVYSLARSLDNQIKAGQSLGNLDVSDLSRAMQEGQAEINKKYQREAKTTDEAINKNRLFHRTESAQASYERAMESEEEAEQAIAKGASEQEAAEIKAGMSKQGAEYGEYLRDARIAIAKRLMPAMAEEVSEDPDVVEANRADAERQAEDGARTIARVMMGEATVEDFQKFSTTNPALREAYEEIAGVSIPEGNKATVDFMINQNEIHYIAEQRNDKARVMLEYADAVFGDKSAASEAFRKSVGDLSKMDENELEGVIRGFSDAYTIGRASEPDAVLPRKTDMMKFLSDEQIEAAFQAGKNDRLARSEMVKTAEEKIAAAKKNGKRKPKIKHDVMSNLNEEERSSEKAKQAAEDMQILQDAMNVTIILETARTTKESGNPDRAEGWYDKDGIHLNIDADTKVKPLEVVFSHEFTHHLQRYAPKEYQKLVEFVIEAKTDNNMQAWESMINQKIIDYASADQKLTRNQAIDEIVADMAYEFLNNKQTVERLFAYDATLAEKVKSVMLNMIKKVLDFFKTHGSQWKGMESELKTARQMWLDAAEVARENADLDLGDSETQLLLEIIGSKTNKGPSLGEQLYLAKEELDQMSVIEAEIEVNIRDIPKGQRANAVMEQLADCPEVLETEALGTIPMPSKSAIKTAINHMKDDAIALSAYPLFPDVLKKGKEITRITNFKGRGFDSKTVASPVKINGVFGYMGIIVRYPKGLPVPYVQKIVFPNGAVFEFPEPEGNKKGGGTTEPQPNRTNSSSPTSPLSDNNVSETEQSRNQNTQKEQGQLSLAATDSTGRQLTKEQQEYFKDSKIRDEQGRLKVMYHGTNNEFTVFDFSQGGKNGTAEGYGIYTSDRKEVSGSYGGRLIEGYVNITRPAASDQKTIKRDELKRLIRATVDAEAERLADDYDGDIAAAAKDSWISNYTYTYDKSLDAAIDEVAGTILNLNDNDMDIVQEVMGGMAIRDYDEAVKFYGMLTDVTGIDGFVTDWTDHTTGESSQIALAFRSNQIKNVTNENPTEDPDIRFSIALGMTPEQRYEELKDKTIRVTDYNPSLMPTDEHELRALESQVKKQAYPVLRDMARGLGLFRDDHKTPDLDIEFSYSGRGIDTSTQIQARVKLDDKYVSMAKMLTCFNDVLRNAHLIEVHEDENELTKRNSTYKQFNELISAYRDGNNIVPVKLTIAEAKDGFNKVQVSIVLDKIKEADLYTRPGLSQLRALPTSEYSLASLLARVKDPSLREYIPAMFYDEAQNVLSEAGMVEQNGRASWLSRRITYLLSEYGGMGNYASAYAARIAPRDYLKLTLRDEMLDKWNGAVNDKAHPEVKSLDEVKLREERQTPFIIIYSDDGTQVRGHEGRHRMRALMEAGITSVPIVIQDNDTKYSKTPLNSMTLTSQDFGDGAVNNNASVVINDLVPINEAYRAELEEQFGAKEGDQVNFSLASDRDRELADLQKKVDRLQRDRRRTYGREAKEGDAVRVAKAILKDTSSDFSLNQTIKGIKNVFQMIKRGDDFAEIYGEIQGLSRSIADSSFDMVEIPGAREEAELRQRFLDARKKDGRPLKILIPQNLIGDFDRVGGWKEFRAAHKGIVTLSVNDGLSYDTFVDSIAEEFGEQYRAEEDNAGIDSLINIIETADSQDARHPERKAYKDEDIDGSIPDDVDMGIMGGYRDAEVNSIIDRLLDDISTEIAPDLTFADRKASEKDEAVRRATTREREKWEARREKWKADRDKRIAEMREDKKLAVEAQRAQGKERLRKQAEMYRRQRERAQQKRADNTSRRKTLNRIYTTAQRLSKKLLTPTDSQHVPEKYRKAVAEVLGWLDFENARTDQWAKRHGNVPSDRILNLRKLRELYAGIANDEQLNQYIEPDDQVYEWMDMLSDLDGTRLDDLETDQLRTVRLILDAVSWQVNNADKMMTEGMKQNRADMATQIMDELAAQKGEKFADSTFKRLMKADSTPAHFFERLGSKTLQKLFKGLTDAQDRHIRNLSEAQDYIEKNVTSKWGNTRKVGPNNSLIKKWTEESQKYTLENGKTVEMTGAQVMSLYALNKREQARKHLLGGGIMIAPTKVKRNLKGGIKEYLLERELSKTRAQLTYADITGILGKMSQDQIDCAEAMLKYLKTTSEWGNETSMKMFGYRKFTEENYFPIQSAKEFIANSNLELQRDKKIKNQGMTKNVSEYANNPIVIDDFFDVTTAHINQMSQYNAFVPILEDFDRIYQYTEFNDKHIVQRSVKEMIEQKHGRWAADYIENLLKNVNGNFGNEVADIQGFEKLLRNWKAAKIGMSVRVLAQQPTAVVRAFNEIDPKYFVGTPKKGSHKRMWEICPIAEWKNWGYAQTDIHRSMRDTMLGDKHISDKLFFDMYGKADNLGWGMIFDAVERETKALMKKGKLNFEYDSAEYRQHVNDRFRHIVDRTQVVDSVLHRSQLMRSQSTVKKAMTAFMAEPTITVNTIMTSFTKAQEEARSGHKAAATKAASKGIAVFVANAVAVSLMSSLISAIRESYLPGDDDDDKEKELSWLQQRLVDLGFEEGSLLYDWISGYFIEDFKSNINPLCLVPISKDMINMLEGYDAPNPLYQLPESLIKNTQNIKKWVDENGDTRYSGRYYIERAAESLAELFGVPAANIRKELIGFQNIYFRAISEKEYGDYLQDRWELNEEYSSNKNTFIDHYLNAKKADHDESAKDIKEQLLQSEARNDDGDLIFTEDAIQKRAWSVYAPNYKDDVIAGKDVSQQERNLLKVGVSQEDIDDKKSKALKSAVGDAVAEGDIDRLEDLRGSLADYGMGDYDVDKKIKSEANDMLYDAIDAGDYKEADKYIKIITDGTEFTRDDVVSTITSHYMSDYYEAMDAGDNKNRKHYESILKKYGMSDQDINIAEGSHYKDYYKSKVYEALERGDTDEAYRIANLYIDRYPYKKENGEVKPNFKNGAEGMIYGLSRTDDAKIREYTTSDKYVNWDIPR